MFIWNLYAEYVHSFPYSNMDLNTMFSSFLLLWLSISYLTPFSDVKTKSQRGQWQLWEVLRSAEDPLFRVPDQSQCFINTLFCGHHIYHVQRVSWAARPDSTMYSGWGWLKDSMDTIELSRSEILRAQKIFLKSSKTFPLYFSGGWEGQCPGWLHGFTLSGVPLSQSSLSPA